MSLLGRAASRSLRRALARAGLAAPHQPVVVVDELEAEALADLLLDALDPLVEELLDAAAVAAHEVLVWLLV